MFAVSADDSRCESHDRTVALRFLSERDDPITRSSTAACPLCCAHIRYTAGQASWFAGCQRTNRRLTEIWCRNQNARRAIWHDERLRYPGTPGGIRTPDPVVRSHVL